MPAARDHCKRGHKFTESNTAYRKFSVGGKSYVIRRCKLCESLKRREKYRCRPKFREYENKRSKDRYHRLKRERFFKKLSNMLDLHYELMTQREMDS